MPPKTNAERQKTYRERLKKEKPDKYEEIRVKHLEKVKENIKKKKQTFTEKDKEEQRAKWRKENARRAETRKKAKNTIQDNNASTLEIRNKARNNTKILQESVGKLIEENTQLKRRYKNLRQKCNRMKRRMLILKTQLDERHQIKTTHCEDTPLTKTNSFLEETLPTISDSEKEKVKKQLLLLNTITDSLKTEFNKADPKEKKVLKKVATNEIANKHKLKSRITEILGLKGNIRLMKARNEVRKKYMKDIHDFFEREDVSRPSAGKNECITRNKDKVQKRYLLKPIYKLYKQYKAEGGEASLQTFYRFRPFYVVKPRLQDRNTCACIKHCNLSFKAISLKKLGLLQTSDIDELMGKVTCSKCFKCMYSQCTECKDKKLAIDLALSENSQVQWLQWKIGTHTYTKISKEKTEEKQTKKYSKQIVKGTVSTLIKEFQDDLQKFKTHYFNITHQYRSWKKCIENLDEDEAALICDFSENFSCKQSEEIQAVHFGGSRSQVTLHTCVLYRKDEKPQSICSISPSNEHSPGAIWAHLDPIMKLCIDNNIEKMHIFSDSPATQYRQKNNFFMFQKRLKEFGFQYATWNYFEASHGKGPADGVGGALKRRLDNHISHGNDITNAKEAYDYLKANSKVKVFYIKENDIQEMIKMIPDNIIPIKGTMKLHQIVMDGKETVKYKWLSCFDCEKYICCDCYYTEEHKLVKTNTVTEQETVLWGKKRQYTEKRETLAKKIKRASSHTTTESDVTTSFHSDSDSIHMEIGHEGVDNKDDEESFENLPMTIESISDIIEKTDFRVKDNKIQVKQNNR